MHRATSGWSQHPAAACDCRDPKTVEPEGTPDWRTCIGRTDGWCSRDLASIKCGPLEVAIHELEVGPWSNTCSSEPTKWKTLTAKASWTIKFHPLSACASCPWKTQSRQSNVNAGRSVCAIHIRPWVRKTTNLYYFDTRARFKDIRRLGDAARPHAYKRSAIPRRSKSNGNYSENPHLVEVVMGWLFVQRMQNWWIIRGELTFLCRWAKCSGRWRREPNKVQNKSSRLAMMRWPHLPPCGLVVQLSSNQRKIS